MAKVRTGLERFLESPPKWVAGSRLGLLCNPASVDPMLNHARFLVDRRLPGKLTALYSPQHGFFAEKQDNMIESADMLEPVLKIPVYSLYGKTRIPTEEMLDPIDVLLVDLQDVGTRVYTFIYTLSYCLVAAGALNKKVVVLDRPNPINGVTIEGNCLKPDWCSFVGRFPLPMRHGLTIGELAQLFNAHFEIGCRLEVVQMQGWGRSMFYRQTGLPWVPPSPNLPSPVSTMVYPGQVLWEGTNVSEGRGTTQPFELFGAPYINPEKIVASFGAESIPGIILREIVFEPTANKWQAHPCRGFQIHIIDPDEYRPYETSLRLLQAVIQHHKKDFEWKPPPYEYETKKLPIDLIIGDGKIRSRLENMEPLESIIESWQSELQAFFEISRGFHLYK
ncbi:MAG: DUF1343 domain-containing protein [Desulfobacterales bacterium]|nr:DUF1343 domain-containing protein [Desulfobacterales bacterium]MDH4009674.1 DUF1343 domain-containing protein [Desulfobacterales bacterium]